jgi:hypothetical protein
VPILQLLGLRLEHDNIVGLFRFLAQVCRLNFVQAGSSIKN